MFCSHRRISSVIIVNQNQALVIPLVGRHIPFCFISTPFLWDCINLALRDYHTNTNIWLTLFLCQLVILVPCHLPASSLVYIHIHNGSHQESKKNARPKWQLLSLSIIHHIFVAVVMTMTACWVPEIHSLWACKLKVGRMTQFSLNCSESNISSLHRIDNRFMGRLLVGDIRAHLSLWVIGGQSSNSSQRTGQNYNMLAFWHCVWPKATIAEMMNDILF
jgi:hypothetical protein